MSVSDDRLVRHVAACQLPTPFGVFTLHGFEEVGVHASMLRSAWVRWVPGMCRCLSDCIPSA